MDEAQFLQAITRSPRDLALVAKFAAWLAAQGDGRGRLLQLEMARRRAEKDLTELEDAIDAHWLFAEVGTSWLDQVLPLEVASPMVGTFYAAPNSKSKPFIQAGDKCERNTIVCIIEATKVFNEIPAGVSGIVSEVLVRDGEPVDYGKVLFRLRRPPRDPVYWS
jgi:biotin carboxyl carrier protein